MSFEGFAKFIGEEISEHYEVSDPENGYMDIYDLASANIANREVFQIKRKSRKNETSHFKTLLLVGLSKKTDLRLAFEWAAAVKEYLLDPEIADLYLFVHWKKEIHPSIEECLRIESTEEFCKKYVIHPAEELPDFISRTFLSAIDDPIEEALGTDPMTQAFSKLSQDFDWFSEEEQTKWKNLFASGLGANEVIEEIFKEKK